MDTITIKIEGRENVSFFISLLEKFNFIKEITVNKKKALQNKGIEEAPIEWAGKRPSIDDFTGIWSDRSITPWVTYTRCYNSSNSYYFQPQTFHVQSKRLQVHTRYANL